MRIVLLGPPGAGKGSLAALYRERLGLAHLSTGEIFRQEMKRGSALGRRVQQYVTSGRLVPDSLVVEVMASKLTAKTLSSGFVLDGFPRTRGQAAGLNRALARARQSLDGVISLAGPEAMLIRRLSGRRVCSTCGSNYNIRTMRPKKPGRCDHCQGTLIVRKDDQPATIKTRLMVDRKAAAPLLAYYTKQGSLYRVSGQGSLEAVFARTVALFRRKHWLPDDRAQNTR